MSFRKEKDLIGEVNIPEEMYYGINTYRAIQNFPITDYRLHPTLIWSLAAVKKAAALSNHSVGSMEKEIAYAISKAADEVMSGKYHEQFLVDVIQGGAGTSINMNANEVIANRALELLGKSKGDYIVVHPNNHVNMAQSTNDVVPSAVHLTVLLLGEKLLRKIRKLGNALEKKAVEFDDVVKMGRTHLQDAVPIRLGQEFSSYSQMVRTDADRIEKAVDSFKEINLGATAVGTGLNADPRYLQSVINNLSDITGIEFRKAQNLVFATQDTGIYVHLSGLLKVLALDLAKISNDLRLMASGPLAGFAEINLPPAQVGSSIMPGKVNPVIPEVVNQVTFQVQGNDLTISLAAGAGQLELNVMVPVLSYNLFQSLEILTNVIEVFKDRCIVGITANKERCQQLVERSVGLATALCPILGYEEASKIAKEALRTGKPVVELVLEKNLLTEDQCREILDPMVLTEMGLSLLMHRLRNKSCKN